MKKIFQLMFLILFATGVSAQDSMMIKMSRQVNEISDKLNCVSCLKKKKSPKKRIQIPGPGNVKKEYYTVTDSLLHEEIRALAYKIDHLKSGRSLFNLHIDSHDIFDIDTGVSGNSKPEKEGFTGWLKRMARETAEELIKDKVKELISEGFKRVSSVPGTVLNKLKDFAGAALDKAFDFINPDKTGGSSATNEHCTELLEKQKKIEADLQNIAKQNKELLDRAKKNEMNMQEQSEELKKQTDKVSGLENKLIWLLYLTGVLAAAGMGLLFYMRIKKSRELKKDFYR